MIKPINIDKLRDKLGLQFIWPSSSAVANNAASNNNLNNSEHATWRAYDSTDRRTCIDWCMSRHVRNDVTSVAVEAAMNQQTTNSRLTVYESWFSDHKPLWLEILFNEHQQ